MHSHRNESQPVSFSVVCHADLLGACCMKKDNASIVLSDVFASDQFSVFVFLRQSRSTRMCMELLAWRKIMLRLCYPMFLRLASSLSLYF